MKTGMMVKASDICLVILSTAIYFALLLQFVNIKQRTWCTDEFKSTDCHCEEGNRLARYNGTDLKVVLPSYGQTGTSSVTEALRMFGLRTYHADDFSVMAKPVMFDGVDWNYWSHTVSRCRMEAMSLEPVTDSLPIAIAMAPNAKFILTWRSFPSWIKSTGATRVKEARVGIIVSFLTRSNSIFPWMETLDSLTGVIEGARMEGSPFWGNSFTALGYIYRIICNGYAWPITRIHHRGTFKCQGSEEAYLAHIDEIRTTVPKDRLFEFDIKRHGWDDLEYMVFGTNSSTPRGAFPQPRSGDMRTNEPLIEKNWDVTGPAYYSFTILHALNFCIIVMVVRLLAISVSALLAASMGPAIRAAPPPTASSAGGILKQWEAALEASPVVALLEGLEPKEAVAVGQALREVGVRLLAVPLRAQGALQSLRLLVDALPPGTEVGASFVLTEKEVCAVRQAGGRFVLSPNMDPCVVQRAKGLGLTSLPGVTSPTEALSALRLGADGLNAFPVEQMPPSTIKALRAVLPQGVGIIAAGANVPDDVAGYWAAGVCGFGASAELFRPGDTPDLVRQRARSLMASCLAARPRAPPS